MAFYWLEVEEIEEEPSCSTLNEFETSSYRFHGEMFKSGPFTRPQRVVVWSVSTFKRRRIIGVSMPLEL